MKSTAVPSRFSHLPNTFEFSGWGTISRIELEHADIAKGDADIQNARRSVTLGQFTASALAGNAILGSVFYSLPAVVTVAGVLYVPHRPNASQLFHTDNLVAPRYHCLSQR